jgi:hypothetical protein
MARFGGGGCGTTISIGGDKMTKDQFLTEWLGDTVEIPLACGGFATISRQDEDRVRQRRWTREKRGYVISWWREGKHKGCVYLHSFIMNTPKGMRTDHEDHNRLNNTRGNLRIATAVLNNANRIKSTGTVSEYKGVRWHAGKWVAQISVQNRNTYLGRFSREEDAARAYNEKASELWGKFALLNEVR